ncbi:MAG: universal stress protein [Chloroflexi bacterium]|nr:universal stress protein [Chloroflexota bacterium]
MRNILVPLDGTEISEAALRWAGGAAYRADSSLRLICVVSNSPDARMSADSAGRYLEEKASALSAEGVKVDCEVIEGDASEVILRQSEQADLTVLTSGTRRWAVSEVFDRVLQSMSSPLAVVPAERGQLNGAINLDSILVPLSGADYSSTVLLATVEVATALRAKLTLFRNVEVRGDELGSNGLPVIMPSLRARIVEAAEYVDQSAEQIRKRGIEVETMISYGDHVEEIFKAARRVHAGLIAMATRGRGGFKSGMAESVAYSVLEAATVACLVVRVSQPPESVGASAALAGTEVGSQPA